MKISTNFLNDIQGNNTQLVPLVVIGNMEGNQVVNPIRLSTNSLTYYNLDKTESYTAKPILLNIPTLKESIDLENRKYTISSVTLNISNSKYNGVRFSESVTSSLVNKEIRIYWTSPNTYRAYWEGGGNDDDVDFLLIYVGKIRDYSHTDDKATISVEDISQSKLHKDLPLLNTGAKDDVPKKYINKPIPMVYGVVSKAPCVIKSAPTTDADNYIDAGNIDIIPDNNSTVSFPYDIDDTNETREPPLYIYKSNGYGNIPSSHGLINFKKTVTDPETELEVPENSFTANEQYDITENTITLISSPEATTSSGQEIEPTNTIGKNQIISINEIRNYIINPRRQISGITFHPDEGNDGTGNSTPVMMYATVLNEENEIAGSVFRELESKTVWDGSGYSKDKNGNLQTEDVDYLQDYPNDEYYQSALIGCTITIPVLDSGAYIDDIGQLKTRFTAFFYDKSNFSGSNTSFPSDFIVRLGGNKHGDNPYYKEFNAETATGTFEVPNVLGATYPSQSHTHNSYNGTDEPLRIENTNELLYYVRLNNNSAPRMGAGTRFHNFLYKHFMLMDNILESDYYADVIGRQLHSSSPERNRMPFYIIKDIFNELGYAGNYVYESSATGNDFPDLSDPATDPLDFSVNEKINSKTLIENICKVSSMVTRFDNSGRLRFDLIEPAYFKAQNDDGEDIYDGDEILAIDVISHSYSRTSIDNIKTRVIVKYDWDYARKEFNKEFNLTSVPNLGDLSYSVSNLSNLSVGTHLLSEYGYNYYGIPQDDSDSTLIIDDDRGKYIKDDQTAKNYAKWLLYWHCNSHLKLKIRLGLKYLWVETGSIVYLDKVISDTNPYGIDYSKSAFYSKGGLNFYGTELNGQQVFPQFMVVSSVKNLDYVELELIQMHNLSNWGVEVEVIFGAINLDSHGNQPINFNSNANFSDGSEIYATYTADIGVCGLSQPEDTYEDYNYDPYADPANAEEYDQYQGGYTGDSYSQQNNGDADRDDVQLNMYNYAFHNHNKAIEYFVAEEPDINQENSKWYIIASEGNPVGACQLVPDIPDVPPQLETLTANFGYVNDSGQEVNHYEAVLYTTQPPYNIPHTISEQAYNSGNIYFKTSWNINIDPNLPCDSITIKISMYEGSNYINHIEYACDPDSNFNEYLSENLLIDFIPPDFFTDYEYQNGYVFDIKMEYKLGYNGSPDNYNYLGFFRIDYELDEPIDYDVDSAVVPNNYTEILSLPVSSGYGGNQSVIQKLDETVSDYLKFGVGYSQDHIDEFMNYPILASGQLEDADFTISYSFDCFVQFIFNSGIAESGEWTQEELEELIDIVENKSGSQQITLEKRTQGGGVYTLYFRINSLNFSDYPALEAAQPFDEENRPSGIPISIKLWLHNDELSEFWTAKFSYTPLLYNGSTFQSGVRYIFNKDENYIEWKWSDEDIIVDGSSSGRDDWLDFGYSNWVAGYNPVQILQQYTGQSLIVDFSILPHILTDVAQDVSSDYVLLIENLMYCSGESHIVHNIQYQYSASAFIDKIISFRITPTTGSLLKEFLDDWEDLASTGNVFGGWSWNQYTSGASAIDISVRTEPDNYTLGDLTGDGIINVLDLVMMVNIILNDGDYNPAGDFDENGIINVMDIIALNNLILS